MATVINGPTIIRSPGDYVLGASFKTSGHGIVVQSAGVTLDLNGKTITGSSAANTSSNGISALGPGSVIVKNGNITGFHYGVYLTGGNNIVEDLTITDSTFRGIRIEGSRNIVRDNQISDIGGTILYPNAYAFGIESLGASALIQNNTIIDVRGYGERDIGEGVGISITLNGNGSVVSRNTIRNTSADVDASYPDWPAQSRSTYAVWVGGDGSRDIKIVGNIVDNYVYGITFKRTVAGSFSDNTVTDTRVPYYLPFNGAGTRVVDGGGNISDIGPTERLFARATAGQIETVEKIYLSPLHRPHGDLYFPLFNDRNGADTHTGTAAKDIIDYWGAPASVQVNLATGSATGGGGKDKLVSIEGAQGSKFSDALVGNGGANLLAGSVGNDSLVGAGGHDHLYGDQGKDRLFGGEGNDRASGGLQNDVLYGGEGADRLDGGGGFDYARYDEVGIAGVWVSLARPSINTGAAKGDTFFGIEGLMLTARVDRAFGNAQDNYLYGLGGNDRLSGAGGNDYVGGGAGDDVLTGGPGSDTFAFGRGYGTDRITDFQGGGGPLDRIDFRGEFTTFAAALKASKMAGDDLVFTLATGDKLIVDNLYRGNFNPDDLVL